jgi:nitroreductase
VRTLSAANRGLAWGEHAFQQAIIAAQRGDREAAVELLFQARREGLGSGPRPVDEPALDALRDSPPMANLLKGPG